MTENMYVNTVSDSNSRLAKYGKPAYMVIKIIPHETYLHDLV